MKSREDQIKEAAGGYDPDDMENIRGIFTDGAKWADKTNPAGKWEADHQTIKLQELGLAEEFPFGCDAIKHVAETLIYTRAREQKLVAALLVLSYDLDNIPDCACHTVADKALHEYRVEKK